MLQNLFLDSYVLPLEKLKSTIFKQKTYIYALKQSCILSEVD